MGRRGGSKASKAYQGVFWFLGRPHTPFLSPDVTRYYPNAGGPRKPCPRVSSSLRSPAQGTLTELTASTRLSADHALVQLSASLSLKGDLSSSSLHSHLFKDITCLDIYD